MQSLFHVNENYFNVSCFESATDALNLPAMFCTACTCGVNNYGLAGIISIEKIILS